MLRDAGRPMALAPGAEACAPSRRHAAPGRSPPGRDARRMRQRDAAVGLPAPRLALGRPPVPLRRGRGRPAGGPADRRRRRRVGPLRRLHEARGGQRRGPDAAVVARRPPAGRRRPAALRRDHRRRVHDPAPRRFDHARAVDFDGPVGSPRRMRPVVRATVNLGNAGPPRRQRDDEGHHDRRRRHDRRHRPGGPVGDGRPGRRPARRLVGGGPAARRQRHRQDPV